MKIKVIIVDDEPLAIDILESYIAKFPNLELVAKCNNAFEANASLQEHEVDLMLLDIQMPQLSGIDLLKTITDPPHVIFTTAYAKYAVEGFEMEAVDYLLKPISLERFMTSINKVIKLMEVANDEDNNSEFFFVKSDKKFLKVFYDDIVYIEGLKDYVIIKLSTSRIVTLQTMKSLVEKLPLTKFQRIHRSYIVGVKHIKAVIGNMVEVKDGEKVKHLPIGKSYRDELLGIINKNRL